MTDNQNPYDGVVGDMLNESSQRRAAAVVAADGTTPDQAAEHNDLARQTGMPVGAVSANPAAAQEMAARRELDDLAVSSPITARWMENQGNYAIARDDTRPLAAIEAAANGPVMEASTVENTSRSWMEWLHDTHMALKSGADRGVAALLESPVNTLNAINAARNWLDRSSLAPDGSAPWLPKGEKYQPISTIQQPAGLKNLATGIRVEAQKSEDSRSARASAFASDPENTGFVGSIKFGAKHLDALPEQVVGTAGYMFPSIGAGAVDPALGLGIFAGQSGSDVQNQVRNTLTEQNQQNAAKGLPTLSDDEIEQRSALAFAVVSALNYVAPKAIPGGTAFRDLLTGKASELAGGKAVRAATAAGGQTATMAALGAGQQAAENVATDRPLDENVGTAAGQSVLPGLAMGVLPAGHEALTDSRLAAPDPKVLALKRALGLSAQTVEGDMLSRVRKVQLETMTSAAAASKLKGRSPAKLEELVSQQSPDATVAVPSEQLAALFQSANLEPAAGAEALLDSPEPYYEAVSTGMPVEIPLANYLARLNPDQHEALAPHAELRPNNAEPIDMPSREEVQAALAEAMKEADAGAERDNGTSGQVFDEVYGQLLPRLGDAGAALNASVVQAMYRTLGARTGRDPYDLWQRFPLNIDTGVPGSPRPKDVDLALDPLIAAAHAGRTFSDQEIYGNSLIPTIIRGGGVNPQPVGGGDLLAADAHLRPGLLSLTGSTVERMAESLAASPEWASVFKTKDDYGRPDPHELVDLIRQELSGDRVNAHPADFREQDRQTRRLDFNEAVGRMGEAFSKHETATGERVQDLPVERQREIARSAFHDPEGDVLLQSAVRDESAIVNPIPHDASPKEKLQAIHALSAENQPLVDAFLREVDQALGTDSKSSLKGDDQILSKASRPSILAEKPWHSIEHVRDTLRFKTVINSLADLPRIADMVRQQGWEVVKVDTEKMLQPKQWGWRFAALDLRMPNGQLVEYYMPFKEMEAAKKPNHVLFEKWRNRDLSQLSASEMDEYARDLEQSNGSFDAAFQSALTRSGADESALRASLDSFNASLESSTRSNDAWSSPVNGEGSGPHLPSRRMAEKPEPSTTTVLPSLDTKSERDIADTSGEIVSPDGGGSELLQGADTPRGSVTFSEPDEHGRRIFNVRLLAGADRSTFMHEAGHAFMEILGDLARDENAPQQVRDDFDTLMRHAGALGATPEARLDWWHRQPVGERRDVHEWLARSFEAYLFEGKSPSIALSRVFQSFKVWLLNIYKTLSGLGVQVNDDVRGVFDRMLASDAEIETARHSLRLDALLGDGDVAPGFPPEVIDRVRRAFAAANADAEASLTAEVLRYQTIEQRKLIAEERKKIAGEVEAEVRQWPEYRAIRWLRNGKLPDGSPAPHPLKLAKDPLLTEYGAEWIKQHLKGMYSKEGGLSPDQAASLLGFGSGDELIQKIAAAPKLGDVVKAETDSRVRERYPDPTTDGTLPDKAIISMHRERVVSALLTEVNALEGRTGSRVRSQGGVLRAAAREIIAGKPARLIQPNVYKIAEMRAGREAFAAAARQDWEGALKARRKQLLNNLLYMAARDAREEAATIERFLRQVNTPRGRAELGKAGADYLEQQDAIFEEINLRQMTGVAIDRAKRMLAWIQRQQEDGSAVAIPQSVIDGALKKPFRELTMNEMRDVRDAVENIHKLADLKNKLLLGKETRDRHAIDNAVAQSIVDGSGFHPRSEYRGDPLLRDRLREDFYKGRGLVAAPAELIAEIEGFKEGGGALTEHTIRVIREASSGEVEPRLRKAAEDSAQLWLDHYSRAELRKLDKKMWIPELKENWSKRRILHLLQNWGNEDNRKAILTQSRQRMNEGDVAVLFKRLDARDGKFTQARWDYMNSYFPELDAAHRRRSGLPLKKVEASPFSFEGKDGPVAVKGGYFPLEYDRGSVKASALIDDAYDQLLSGGTMKPKVQDGQTIERKGSGGNAVDLTIDHFDGSIRDTIRLTHLADAVNYAHKVLHGHETGEAFRKAGMLPYHEALKLWLKDVAAGEMGPRNGFERFLRMLRSNVITAHLGLAPLKAIAHMGGFFVSAARLGPHAMALGIRQYFGSPIRMAKYIHEASPAMRLREGQTAEAIGKLSSALDPGWKRAKDGVAKASLFVITKVWAQVERATWLAAEAKGIKDFGGDLKKARDYADSIVSATQGSSAFIEKSALRRGTLSSSVRQAEVIKASTTMMSYLSAKSDLLYRAGYIAHRDSAGFSLKTARAVMKLATVIALACTADGLTYTIAQEGIPQNPKEWFQEASSGTLDESLGTIPIIGHTLATLAEYATVPLGGKVPGGYEPKTPYGNLIEDLTEVAKSATAKKFNKAAVLRAASNTVGALTGLPMSQVNKTMSAINAADHGKAVGPLDYLTGYKKPKRH